jgi:hypothetical protein
MSARIRAVVTSTGRCIGNAPAASAVVVYWLIGAAVAVSIAAGCVAPLVQRFNPQKTDKLSCF